MTRSESRDEKATETVETLLGLALIVTAAAWVVALAVCALGVAECLG